MIDYREKEVYDLRCLAEAKEREPERVTVELSVPAAWLMRDLIGLQQIGAASGLTLQDDMLRLNAVLGYRLPCKQGELPAPHVSGWSQKAAQRATARR